MMREYTVLELFSAKRRTATANGTGVDLQPYINTNGRELKAYLNVGYATSSASPVDPTLDVKIQESADNVTFTDISGATFTQATAATSEAIHFQTNLRYFRAVATIGGTTPVIEFAVVAVAVNRVTLS